MRSARAIELIVGLFMLAGIASILVLALKVSGLSTGSIIDNKGYFVTADFDTIGSLKIRSPVTIAGIHVGEVTNVRLDKNTYRAVVTMLIDQQQTALPTDTSASIYTQGLLGANYISLTPGYDTAYLKNGSVIQTTHPALILEDLIGQFLFSINNKDKDDADKKDAKTT